MFAFITSEELPNGRVFSASTVQVVELDSVVAKSGSRIVFSAVRRSRVGAHAAGRWASCFSSTTIKPFHQ
jgi:hypothetical protein